MVKPASYIRSWGKYNKFPFQLLAALRICRSSVPAKIVECALVLAEGADARLADVEKIDDLLKTLWPHWGQWGLFTTFMGWLPTSSGDAPPETTSSASSAKRPLAEKLFLPLSKNSFMVHAPFLICKPKRPFGGSFFRFSSLDTGMAPGC